MKIRYNLSLLIRRVKAYKARLEIQRDLKYYPILTKRVSRELSKIYASIQKKTDGRVFTGPFSEMKLVWNDKFHFEITQLIGSYEKEIHPMMNSIIASPPVKIIDIGSALGYYVVGFALYCSKSEIVGYEMIDQYRLISQELAKVNGVADRIAFKGLCDIHVLNNEVVPGSFILCDCEGAELDLLDPEEVPGLKETTILCELHEFFRPGCTNQLINRFKDSHDITLIDEMPRNPNDYRILIGIPEILSKLLAAESRYIHETRLTSIRFMFLKPKNKG